MFGIFFSFAIVGGGANLFYIRKTKKKHIGTQFLFILYSNSIVVLKLVRKMRFEKSFLILFGFEIVIIIQTTDLKKFDS